MLSLRQPILPQFIVGDLQMPLAIRKVNSFHVLLAAFLFFGVSLAASAQVVMQVVTPTGDALIEQHVQGASYSLFDLYDMKTGACVVRIDLAVVDPATKVQGKLSNPNVDYLEEVGHIKAGLGKNRASLYKGPAVQLGAPCAGGTGGGGGATPVAGGDLPACPQGSLANYWSGTSWVPMRAPEMLNGKRGFNNMDAVKNPFSARSGFTAIVQFRGPEAPVTLGSSPTFCFFAPQNASTDVLVGFVDDKDGHREIEIRQQDRGPEKWIPLKRQKAATTKFVGNSAIVTLNEPLPAGQYLVGTNTFNMFDFGVK